jgi:hypothetical protein
MSAAGRPAFATSFGTQPRITHLKDHIAGSLRFCDKASLTAPDEE